MADGFLEYFQGVDVVKKDDRPEEVVRPPTRYAFGGVVCWEGDMWGKFLGARGEEELVVSSAEDAAGVGVDEYVYDLRVVSSTNVDEGVEWYAGGTFEGGDHGICVWVFERNDVASGVGG